ncbi:hypothetical protein [Phyllobacterium endophyticum]|uniref:Uncharacterized protein n=1 Tax=Phyllobacterium endophyticum TaxID=1149773 RepID=A0A2P7AUV2_9HYPH|nr:hypothetical protein [Phyllobacterium endophyticum]MBB3234508.1 hypothetical protein [Phyllobacterium endophyticum]PSH57999.1 hypothetical protein CU100_10030 [Phyllobacterium endophyticum]TYR38666.1 hypothetical protein FY050_21995 [Phyllobacterium endophyticum]
MSRSRGEPPEGLIDREYPFQIAVLACEVSWRFENVMFLAEKLGSWRLHRSLSVDGEGFIIYRFSRQEGAECFLKAFDGEWITPAERKKGTWRSKNVRMLVGRDVGLQVRMLP